MKKVIMDTKDGAYVVDVHDIRLYQVRAESGSVCLWVFTSSVDARIEGEFFVDKALKMIWENGMISSDRKESLMKDAKERALANSARFASDPSHKEQRPILASKGILRSGDDDE